MTKTEFIAIRERLGLSPTQLAIVLEYGQGAGYGRHRISEFERGAREIPRLVARLMTAYDEGYRPKDWPSLEEAA